MTANNQSTDEALLSIWLEIPGSGDMYADVVAFARAVLAAHGAAPVNDNAVCGAQNGEGEGQQDAIPAEEWLDQLTHLLIDLCMDDDAAAEIMAHARRRITGE
ncbi:hypothetical protein H0A71_06355 [Alcaligenaceae bacterium]|nr:hypothetical protein [Alcaligenaceae bacterium]